MQPITTSDISALQPSSARHCQSLGNLILIRGLPGSGKSTLAEKFSEHCGYTHVEADMYHMHLGQYRFDLQNAALAHEWCINTCFAFLHAGKNVVVSNTFTMRSEMFPYFRMGVYPAVITANGKYLNSHNVPTDVLDDMVARWET